MKNKTLYIVFIALMAAMVFVCTYFLGFTIPTPAGPTMIKTANIICLLGGMLFGGLTGGLAAGIGSMLFDLSNPAYVSSAPFTLIFFFIMGAVCGLISHARGARGLNTKQNIIAAICGSASYFILHIGKSIITSMLLGNTLWIAIATNSTRMLSSGINALIAIVFAVILAKPLISALQKAGIINQENK